MSDAPQPDNAPTPEPQPDERPRKRSGGPLRIALFVILAILLPLVLLDVYSRHATTTAFAKVQDWVDDVEKKGHVSPEEVRQLLGRKPDNGLEDMGQYYQEIYSWPRGRLYDTYYVRVLYEKHDDQAFLFEVVQNTEPEGSDIPRPPLEDDRVTR